MSKYRGIGIDFHGYCSTNLTPPSNAWGWWRFISNSEWNTVSPGIHRKWGCVCGYWCASLLNPSAPPFALESKVQPFELSGEVYELLVYLINMDSQPLVPPKSALSVKGILIGGVSYSTSRSTKFQESNIIFSSPASNDNILWARSVEAIFHYTYKLPANQELSEYFLAIREYLLMDGSGGLVDIYKTFGFASGYLCQPHPETLHVICLANLVSHFTLTPIQLWMTELIHILPIDRVWPSIVIPTLTYMYW